MTRHNADGLARNVVMAQEALVSLLLRDPLVERTYKNWRRGAGLDVYVVRFQCAITDDARAAAYHDLLLCSTVAGAVVPQLLTAVVLPELPACPWPWLPSRLAAAFMARLENEALPGGAAVVTGIKLPGNHQVRSRHRPNEVQQHVDWLYRHRIQRPPESIGALNRERLRRLKDRTVSKESRSAVQRGIARAEQLLAWTPPK